MQDILSHPWLQDIATNLVVSALVFAEQNVRYQLDPHSLSRYEKLYAKCHGREVMQDSSEYRDNYRRIVRLLGGTFRGMGIEILLHDLVNPSRSITAIGARNFNCTTIPIVREPYGIVGAVCMNIDDNYIRDHVLKAPGAVEEFFSRYCAIDMRLDEKILSRPEYEKAVPGKRHWQDA